MGKEKRINITDDYNIAVIQMAGKTVQIEIDEKGNPVIKSPSDATVFSINGDIRAITNGDVSVKPVPQTILDALAEQKTQEDGWTPDEIAPAMQEAEAQAQLQDAIEDVEKLSAENLEEPKQTGELTDEDIGKLISGKGIYLGTWDARDENGWSLKKVFNLYAATTDLLSEDGEFKLLNKYDLKSHMKTQKIYGFIKKLTKREESKKFEGHALNKMMTEKQLIRLIRENPERLENWFVPTIDMLQRFKTVNDDLPKRSKVCQANGKYKAIYPVALDTIVCAFRFNTNVKFPEHNVPTPVRLFRAELRNG